MIGRRYGRCALAGAALGIAIGAGGGKAAMATSFSLAITGAEGARYAGRCTLKTAAGEETFELAGVVPRHEEVTGEGLTCRIEAAGRITVEVTHGGGVSRSVTSGGTVNFAVR
jgi:hypothetical protein